jgi:uncharacterized radical SAM superfamily Fe-S cluster-containing enzyme
MCSTCLERVDAKIVFQDDNVFMLKNCLDHGPEKTLIATDVDYYKKIRHYIKPSDLPKKFNTKVEHGCPYDCGLCVCRGSCNRLCAPCVWQYGRLSWRNGQDG